MRAVVVPVLLSLALSARAADVAKLLADAEAIRAADKVHSRQLLNEAERALAASPQPLLIAQAQLLECRWADDPPTAYRAVETGLAAADRAKSLSLRAKLVFCRARALQFGGRVDEAEREYESAAAFAARAHEPSVQAGALISRGELQYQRGAMADALTNIQAGYRISERIGDERSRLEALSGIANVYADSNVGQYDRAIEYYRQLLAAYQKLGARSDVADTLFNIGSTLEVMGNYAASEANYRRALAEFKALKQPSDVAYTERAIGSAVMKQGRAAESLPHFNAALAYYERKGDAGNTAYVLQFRGFAYRRLGRANEALQDLAFARRYFEAEKLTRFLERNAEETALVYESLGDWRNAYEARRRQGALQQELASARRDELSSRLRVEFDAEKKEQENRSLARENALRAAALRESQRSQTLQRAVIALTALLATALALLFWRQVTNTRRVRAMALTDELTRLPNRRHILTSAGMVFAEAKRQQKAATVIVFDIDRFKRINDTYGHAAGDVVLKGVAHTCRMTLRPNDQVGRIGGEEFLVVLHDTTAQQAAEIAERLRAAVEQIDFSTIAPDLRVTISLGVHRSADYDLTSAIAMADALLYRAKEGGRNRVELATAS
jgi:diguanylate cyclase (GGDEF)-like protein